MIAGARSRAALTLRRAAAARWPDHSRLFLMSGPGDWVLGEEMRRVGEVALGLGARLAPPAWIRAARRQSVFWADQFALRYERWDANDHRVGLAYFHGLPGTPGFPEFDEVYERLCLSHERIDRVQVSHSEIRDLVLSSGIDPAKVFQIPIAIALELFPQRTEEQRLAARRALGLPDSAFVVGSLLKDGVGWGEGLEAKLIKGPDVLLRALELARARVPELYVVLTGPARGYVKAGLDRLGIPYVHRLTDAYEEIPGVVQALDAMLVASRQEGGPKAVLEAMATGVPLVTTRAGQAMDLVLHGENGFMVQVEDGEGLAEWLAHVARAPGAELDDVVRRGRLTAEAHSYEAQAPLWRDLLTGFVRW